MPDVRGDADCRRLIATLRKPVYRGCFTLIYAYGLRITEAVTLPVTAVDSKQMVLRVIGKRNKERILPLTDSILQMLRQVWKRGDVAGAAILWEAAGEAEVRAALASLPIFAAGMLEIVAVVPLEPYPGFGPA